MEFAQQIVHVPLMQQLKIISALVFSAPPELNAIIALAEEVFAEVNIQMELAARLSQLGCTSL